VSGLEEIVRFVSCSLPLPFYANGKHQLLLVIFPDVGSAGGFVRSYAAHCNQQGCLPQDEFVYYIKHCKTTDLVLSNCPGVEPKTGLSINLHAVGAALMHNTYFKYALVMLLVC